MKNILSLVIILAISFPAICQIDGDQKKSNSEDLLEMTVQKLESLDNNSAKFEMIISLLDSDDTEPILKMGLLDKYLEVENLENIKFKDWLMENLDFKSEFTSEHSLTQKMTEKYPILYFFAQQDKEVFSVDDLMDSKLMADCNLFDDPYHKMMTCKLLAEVIASQDGRKFNKYTDSDINECAYKNYQKISELCIGYSIKSK